MSDHTPDALASALPAGIQYHLTGGAAWNTADVAKFQAERLAESGYTLVAPDEATAERVAQALIAHAHSCSCCPTIDDQAAHPLARAVLAALAEDPAVTS